MLRSAGVRVLRSGRLLSSSARSRVKILGSDEAYNQIATVRDLCDFPNTRVTRLTGWD